MKTRLLAFALAIASTFAFTPAFNIANATPVKTSVATPNKVAAISTPVSGSNALASFVGNFDITRFVSRGGQLYAVGTLTGTLTNLGTGATNSISQIVRVPVTATGTCDILTLHIGAIHLDLLGLVVDLAPVDLQITAQSGPGNLLGNLLCAVANLLNGQGSLNALAQLLNQILGIVTIP